MSQSYAPRRIRSTGAEVRARREALLAIVAEMKPMTVRQVYYQATVRGIVDKTEGGYGVVKHDLTLMRKAGSLPYEWLADSTRWQRKPRTFGSVQQALENTARLYRKSLWADADAYVEIWLEKDALSGVVYPITSMFDAPLMIARGYASLSFLHSAAEAIADLEVPAYIYHLGDFDPSGQDAARAIEQTLREMAPKAEIHFERLAVTPEQIRQWGLQTRPTKASDSRSKGFGDVSVNLTRFLRTNWRPRSGGDRTSPSVRAIRDPQGRGGKRTPTDQWPGRHGQGADRRGRAMTSRILLSGTLASAAIRRKRRSDGAVFAIAKIRDTDRGLSRTWTLFVNDPALIEQIEEMRAGEPIAVAGPFTSLASATSNIESAPSR